MAGATIRVQGLAELNRAFRQVDVEAAKGFRNDLLAAAAPVAASARDKIGRFQGASLGTIKPVALVRSVAVVQNARKVTGLRGDYGQEQMEDLISALAENEEKVVSVLELALDRVAGQAGF